MRDIDHRERIDLPIIANGHGEVDQIVQELFLRRENNGGFILASLVAIWEQFKHAVEGSSALTGCNLDDLHQFAQRLGRRDMIVVKAEVDGLRQHAARLYRVGTHHF